MTQPHESIQWLVQFAAPWSAWWLALLWPALLVLGYRLYRQYPRGVKKANVWVLMALRLVALGLLAFLLFRPSVVRRTVLAYPGRLLFVVDDSRSMTARDTHLPASWWERVARSLNGAPDTQAHAFHHMAQAVWGGENALRTFERNVRALDPEDEAYWAQAAQTEEALSQAQAALERFLETAHPADEQAAKDWAALKPRLQAAAVEWSTTVRSSEGAQATVLAAQYQAAQELREGLNALQARSDRASGPSENAVKFKDTPRLALNAAALKRVAASHESLFRDYLPQVVSLQSGKITPLEHEGRVTLEAQAGPTELVARLQHLVAEESKFPISGIVVLSDGRTGDATELAALGRVLSQQQIPVICAGIGGEEEPIDAAVMSLAAPPFAVKDAKVSVRGLVKATSADQEVSLAIATAAKNQGELKLPADGRRLRRAELAFTPDAAGLVRYEWTLGAAPGEIFPRENNRAEFAVDIRNDKVKVLLLDEKARWQTRFVINTLRRLDYIELNTLVMHSLPDGTLTRGVRRGSWPQDAAALEMYDLVILGDLPTDTLSAQEWDDLRALVEEKGRTVLFLAPSSPPPQTAVSTALWPQRMENYTLLRALEHPAQLRLTPSGRHHPLTAALDGSLELEDESRIEQLRTDTVVLLADAKRRRPLLSCRQTGRGKTALLSTDRLWKALNPTLLEAHDQLVVELVTWAVRKSHDLSEAESGRPVLTCDRRVLHTGQTLQAWVREPQAGTVVEAWAQGKKVAEAKVERPRPDAELGRAWLSGLPAEDLELRLAGEPAASIHPVAVLQHDDELKQLARDAAFLDELARASGGVSSEYLDVHHLITRIPPRENVERAESEWRLWDSGWVLAFCVLLLTGEWVYRKWVGLV